MSAHKLRIKALREAKGLTQDQMAEMMKIVPRQFQRYERGEQEPKLAGWIFLADFFDVSLDYLVGRSSDSKRRG